MTQAVCRWRMQDDELTDRGHDGSQRVSSLALTENDPVTGCL